MSAYSFDLHYTLNLRLIQKHISASDSMAHGCGDDVEHVIALSCSRPSSYDRECNGVRLKPIYMYIDIMENALLLASVAATPQLHESYF